MKFIYTKNVKPPSYWMTKLIWHKKIMDCLCRVFMTSSGVHSKHTGVSIKCNKVWYAKKWFRHLKKPPFQGYSGLSLRSLPIGTLEGVWRSVVAMYPCCVAWMLRKWSTIGLMPRLQPQLCQGHRKKKCGATHQPYMEVLALALERVVGLSSSVKRTWQWIVPVTVCFSNLLFQLL